LFNFHRPSSSYPGSGRASQIGTSPIFDMDNMNNDLNMVEELDEFQDDEKSGSAKSLNISRETVASGPELTDLIFKTSPMPSSLPLTKNRMSGALTNILHNKAGDETSQSSKMTRNPLEKKQDQQATSGNENPADNVFECDRVSLNSVNVNSSTNSKQVNISTTAFNTFTKIIPILGPVLTCKYCCVDLLKMLAICYMNSKCLSLIETGGKFSYFLAQRN
jgi:hypothetical protein